MQQFSFLLVCLVYVITPTSAAVLPLNDMGCGSSATIGNIDLGDPGQKQAEPAAPTQDDSVIAFVPLETPLTGSVNAPTAFNGVASVKVPGPGPADYRGDCNRLLVKPAP